MMPAILCLDTSGRFLSVALSYNNQISTKHQQVERSHTKHLVSTIKQLLAEAGMEIQDLDALAFGCGPGSFTGIRIAASFAHGIACGSNIRLIPVSTLATLAATGYRLTGKTHVLTALDARIEEVYWAQYQVVAEGPVSYSIMALDKEQLSKSETIVLKKVDKDGNKIDMQACLAIGDGFRNKKNLPEAIQALACLDQQTPLAEDMLHLATAAYIRGRSVQPEQAQPVYLRQQYNL